MTEAIVCDRAMADLLFLRPIVDRKEFLRAKSEFDRLISTKTKEDLGAVIKFLNSVQCDDISFREAYVGYIQDILNDNQAACPCPPLDYYISEGKKVILIKYSFKKLLEKLSPNPLRHPLFKLKANADLAKIAARQEFIDGLRDLLNKRNDIRAKFEFLVRKKIIWLAKQYRFSHLLAKAANHNNPKAKWLKRIVFQVRHINWCFKNTLKALCGLNDYYIKQKLRKATKYLFINMRKHKVITVIKRVLDKFTRERLGFIYDLIHSASKSTKDSKTMLLAVLKLKRKSYLMLFKKAAKRNWYKNKYLKMKKALFLRDKLRTLSTLSKQIRCYSVMTKCLHTFKFRSATAKSIEKWKSDLCKKRAFAAWSKITPYFNTPYAAFKVMHSSKSEKMPFKHPKMHTKEKALHENDSCLRVLSVIHSAIEKRRISTAAIEHDQTKLIDELTHTASLILSIKSSITGKREKINAIRKASSEDIKILELLQVNGEKYRSLDTRYNLFTERNSSFQLESVKLDVEMKKVTTDIYMKQGDIIRLENELKRIDYELSKKITERQNLMIENDVVVKRVNLSPVNQSGLRSRVSRTSPMTELYGTVSPNKEKMLDFMTGSTRAQTNQKFGIKDIMPEQLHTVRRKIDYEEENKTSILYKMIFIGLLVAILGLLCV